MLNGQWPHGLSTWNWVCDAIIISRGLLRDFTTSPINRFAALLINIFKQRGCLPMTGTSRIDRGRSNVSITCWDTSFITFYTSSLYLHFLQYATDRRQNIIKCCLDHKTSVRARRRLFIIVYKYFIPSAMILSNIKYFSNLPPRISISLKINMSGWWWWCWG